MSLFVGVFSTGISYADRFRKYKKIAFLPYSTLELEIYDPDSRLLPEILKDSEKMKAMRGKEFQISTSGQTIVLGKAH